MQDAATFNVAHFRRPTVKPSIFMAISESVSQQITISKGAAWAIGTALFITPILITLAVYLASGAMGYQTVISRVGVTESRLDKDEKAIEQLQGMVITVNNVQNDVKTIRENQTKSDVAQTELIKSVNQLTILSAQKQLAQ